MNIKSMIRKELGNFYKSATLHGLYPKRYKKRAKCRVNPRKIVFLEVRMPELTDSFYSVYRELEKTGSFELTTVCIREGTVPRKQQRMNCLSAIEQIADASWIFVNDSCYFLSSLPLRPETKVVQLWHACGAFKRFGYSVADQKFGASRKDLARFPVHKNFDYVTVSSGEVAWAYAEAFHMEDRPECFLPTGICRTDCFFDLKKQETAREKLLSIMPQAKGRRVVLYAPTFRGKVATATSPDFLDLERLREKLEKDTVIVIKHHPFVKEPPVIPESCKNFAMDVTKNMEIEDLLCVSDVCISDYSSLIFEYALMDRPMLFLVPDLEDYYDWRGFYYPFEELTPGPVLTTTKEVLDALEHMEKYFDREKLRVFREKYMSGCDGHATEKLLNRLGLMK